ncbi:MAG: glycosyltransferase family 39 protein [Bdellovibrionota bacterium]
MKDRLPKVALAIAVFMTIIRFLFSGLVGLGDDEAYYWDWSRNLSLSYYDHPGMVGWLIRLSTEIFGQNPFAVRFFGLVCSAIAAVCLFKLSEEIFDRRTAWLTLLIYSLAPILSIGGILMVPDAPMAAAWMGFTYLLWKIWSEPITSLRLWLIAGVVLGFGLLSKYTIILCALSGVALFLFSNRITEFKRPRIYLAILIAAVLCLPIILWNVQYDWPSLKFHLKERQSGGGGANYNRWIQFFVSQAVALGPVLFVACVSALVVAFRRFMNPKWRFIALVSSPPLLIFTAQALFAEFKPHWPAPSYPLLFIGVSVLYFEWRDRKAKSFTRKTLVAFTAFYFVLLNGLFYTAGLMPIIPKLARSFAPQADWDPKFDPTNDLYGWPEVVAEVNKIRDSEEAAGLGRPFLSSSRYQLVSQIAFAAQEPVIRVSPTKDQYTFTQTEEILAPYLGKNSIFITDHRYERDPNTDPTFESCEKRDQFKFYRREELSRIFNIWICRGFKGLN